MTECSVDQQPGSWMLLGRSQQKMVFSSADAKPNAPTPVSLVFTSPASSHRPGRAHDLTWLRARTQFRALGNQSFLAWTCSARSPPSSERKQAIPC